MSNLMRSSHTVGTNRLIALFLSFILIAAGAWIPAAPVSAIERDDLTRALLATVQVVVPISEEEDSYSSGSGTVLSESGLILTNYHVMGDIDREQLYNDRGFAGIAINPPTLKSPPVLRYAALLIGSDPELDLALLQIVGLIEDVDAPLPEDLGLTPIEVGDSQSLLIGDEINAFGFPTAFSNSITFTTGRVAGFRDDDVNGYNEWLTVDVNINHGNSGGLATNGEGEFVGVPTIVISDLGTLGLVRDGNMAMEFVNRALLQIDEPADGSPEEGPRVSNVQFAPAVDTRGRPLSPAVRFASGATVIYATFDHTDFEEGRTFTFVWYRDGFEVFRDQVTWTFGADGSNWVNVYSEEGLSDGYYELALSFAGRQIFREGLVVGAGDPPGAVGSIGPITFAEGVTEDDQPINPGTNFADISEIYAFFDTEEIANGRSWTRRWILDGEVITEKEEIWNMGESTSTWISLSLREGTFPVGRYRLEIDLEEETVQSAEMDVVESEALAPTTLGLLIVGTVVAADNRRNVIEGATVFFLNPGVTVEEFLDDPSDERVFASGVTVEDGSYQLDRRLSAGTAYGVVVYHEEYRIVAVDGYEIETDATSPWEVNITMERR